MEIPTHKVCTKCEHKLPLSEFYLEKKSKYGRRADCRKCCINQVSNRNSRKLGRPLNKRLPKITCAEIEIHQGEKRCGVCLNWKLLDQFNRSSKYKDGLNYLCRDCKRIKSKVEAQLYKPQRKENRLKYYQANKEKFQKLSREWSKTHLAIKCAQRAKYKARKIGNGGSHTHAEWEYVKIVNGNKCLKCGKPEGEVKLTKDHIVPLALGGNDFFTNLQPLCRSCNSSKNKTFVDYRIKKKRAS